MSNQDKIENADGSNPSNAPRTPTKQKTFPWKTIIVILAVVAVGFFVVKRRQAGLENKSSPTGAKGGAFPVSVVIGTVAQKDIPIYFDGLGTVQAFNTVTIRSRVDGQLQKLAFIEGQDVRAGELLAQIDPDPFRTQVEQAEAKKAQDAAQLANAQVELKRDADLLVSKIVSQEVYDTQKAQTLQFEAAVKADQAAIDSARVQLNYTTIAAPIDGRTGIRFVDAGNIVRASDTNGIVVVTQLKPISVIFTLPEQNLGEIQQQFSAGEMKVLAVDRDSNTILDEGKLSVIDNQIDTTTGTIRLKGTFPNPNLRLWPGQFVNTRLLLKVRTNAIVVPASVVQRGPEGAYAFVVSEDMTAKMQPVKVGLVEQEQAVIDSGLQPGERVVVDGQYKLQPGAKVVPAKSQGATNANTNAPNGSDHSGKRQKSGDKKKSPPSNEQ